MSENQVSPLRSMQSSPGGRRWDGLAMGGKGVWEAGGRNRFSESSDEGLRDWEGSGLGGSEGSSGIQLQIMRVV